MSAAATPAVMPAERFDACRRLLAKAPADGQGWCMVPHGVLADLVRDAGIARELHALVNTPELVDFARGVHLEAVHQVQRWGAADRLNKLPNDWFWLLSHLASRALEHHKEAERLAASIVKTADMGELTDHSRAFAERNLAHHREKAAHHTITAAAVLAHWHACVIGRHTSMEPGHSASKALAAELLGDGP